MSDTAADGVEPAGVRVSLYARAGERAPASHGGEGGMVDQQTQTMDEQADDTQAVDQQLTLEHEAYRQLGRSLFEQRLLLDLPVPPWLAAALVSLVAFLLSALPNLLYHEVFTRVVSRSPADARFGYFGDEATWSAFVWSLLLGYVLGGLAVLPRRAIADTLASVQHIPDEIMQTRTRSSMVGLSYETIRGSRRVGAIWALFGFAGLIRTAWVLLAPSSLAEFALPFFARFAWFIVVVPATCFVIGRAAYISIRTSRSSESDLLKTLRFHVLDASPFDGLVRMATRTSAVWIGGATICSLFLFNVPMRYLGATLPLALSACAMAAAVIWMPLININRRMRELKRLELQRVLKEIERDRNSLSSAALQAAEGTVIASRLTALLAYRDAVRQAPEWPIGISNGSRILVLMVLPVLGWVAAALVERLLGAALTLG